MSGPFDPINGISLERYAELGAAVTDHMNDQEACVRIVEGMGVSRADWNAAVAGWTARMQDPALMGGVATQYMPLYQAALNRLKGSADVSFDDFITLSAARKAWGSERANAYYQMDDSTWTQVATPWTTQRIPQNPQQYGMYGMHVEQEAARLSQGGQPRGVNILRTVGGGAPAPAGAGGGGAGGGVNPNNPQLAQNQLAANMVHNQVASTLAQAQNQSAAAYGQVSQNVGFFGRLFLKLTGNGAIAAGIGPGMSVLVQWSDGQKYPAQVIQVSDGKVCVAMQNGQQHWVPENAVSKPAA